MNGFLWRYSPTPCDAMPRVCTSWGLFFGQVQSDNTYTQSHQLARFFFLESRADSELTLLLSSGYDVLPGLPHHAYVYLYSSLCRCLLILSKICFRTATPQCSTPHGMAVSPPNRYCGCDDPLTVIQCSLSTALCTWQRVDLEVRHPLFTSPRPCLLFRK